MPVTAPAGSIEAVVTLFASTRDKKVEKFNLTVVVEVIDGKDNNTTVTKSPRAKNHQRDLGGGGGAGRGWGSRGGPGLAGLVRWRIFGTCHSIEGSASVAIVREGSGVSG